MDLFTTIKRVAFVVTAAGLMALSFGSLQAIQPTDVIQTKAQLSKHV